MVVKDKNVTDQIDDKGSSKIISMIKFLVHPLAENMKYFAEKKKYFLIEMNNYFIMKNLMEILR